MYVRVCVCVCTLLLHVVVSECIITSQFFCMFMSNVCVYLCACVCVWGERERGGEPIQGSEDHRIIIIGFFDCCRVVRKKITMAGV